MVELWNNLLFLFDILIPISINSALFIINLKVIFIHIKNSHHQFFLQFANILISFHDHRCLYVIIIYCDYVFIIYKIMHIYYLVVIEYVIDVKSILINEC